MTDEEQTLSTKAYAAPTLVIYGAMAELTASGSGSKSETATKMGKKRQKP